VGLERLEELAQSLYQTTSPEFIKSYAPA
jgi:hypothetical protein